MKNPKLFDIVETLYGLPEHKLPAGTRGVIVEQYSNDEFEVEFANDAGETIALCTLPRRKFTMARQLSTQPRPTAAVEIIQIEATRPSVRTRARRKPKARSKGDTLKQLIMLRKQELARRLSE